MVAKIEKTVKMTTAEAIPAIRFILSSDLSPGTRYRTNNTLTPIVSKARTIFTKIFFFVVFTVNDFGRLLTGLYFVIYLQF